VSLCRFVLKIGLLVFTSFHNLPRSLLLCGIASLHDSRFFSFQHRFLLFFLTSHFALPSISFPYWLCSLSFPFPHQGPLRLTSLGKLANPFRDFLPHPFVRRGSLLSSPTALTNQSFPFAYEGPRLRCLSCLNLFPPSSAETM